MKASMLCNLCNRYHVWHIYKHQFVRQFAGFPYLESSFLFSTSHDLLNSSWFIMIDGRKYGIRTLPKMGSFCLVALVIKSSHLYSKCCRGQRLELCSCRHKWKYMCFYAIIYTTRRDVRIPEYQKRNRQYKGSSHLDKSHGTVTALRWKILTV